MNKQAFWVILLLTITLSLPAYCEDLSVDQYCCRALINLSFEEYDLAIENSNKAISIDPNASLAYSILGDIYSDKGQYDQAISNYRKSIEIKPDYIHSYKGLGDIYTQKGQPDIAKNYYDKAKELEK